MKHKCSKETLWHFQCQCCNQWWTIGDFNPDSLADGELFCPNCGHIDEFEEVK